MGTETVIEVATYMGRPVLAIKKGERVVISFGLAKAKAILDHIEDIESFVEEYDQ